jgi:hypothetical protein
VIKIFLPGTAFPLFTNSALHAVSPAKGNAAASASDKCAGASSTSLASTTMVSASVPDGFVFVPPRMA